MRTLALLGLLCVLGAVVAGCGVDSDGDGSGSALGDPVATAGGVRFSLPTPHRVVVERRTAEGWGDPLVVFEDLDRECGTVRAVAAGPAVAATVGCDDHFAEDQAPAHSVALISSDARTWTHRDLDGEAYQAPGLSPRGTHAVWVQGDDLLVWEDGSFRTVRRPAGSAQLFTVDEHGTILGVGVGTVAGRCAVEVGAGSAGASVVPVARADELLCDEIGLSSAGPSGIHGEIAGQPGTDFDVRRSDAGTWFLEARPPVAAPGLDVYADDPARAIWNQVAANTRGDLVAVGSPDRQHLTAQRYDRARQRWTPSRVVHDAGAPVCRRSIGDSGVLQGATFRLRLVCDGRPVVLRSRTGTTWDS
jgi:hypothetical protein